MYISNKKYKKGENIKQRRGGAKTLLRLSCIGLLLLPHSPSPHDLENPNPRSPPSSPSLTPTIRKKLTRDPLPLLPHSPLTIRKSLIRDLPLLALSPFGLLESLANRCGSEIVGVISPTFVDPSRDFLSNLCPYFISLVISFNFKACIQNQKEGL